jgi:hypothetical protein
VKTLDVIVDLDGVCYDFIHALRKYRKFKHDIPYSKMPENHSWNFFSDEWGMTLDEFISTCQQSVAERHLFWEGSPLTGTEYALEWLHEQGHRIHIVTDRSGLAGDLAREATEHWLSTHSLPYTSLTISADKTAVRGDIAIDDRDINYDALDAAGSFPWLRDQPWNYAHPGRRVRSWGEFIDQVHALSASSLVRVSFLNGIASQATSL